MSQEILDFEFQAADPCYRKKYWIKKGNYSIGCIFPSSKSGLWEFHNDKYEYYTVEELRQIINYMEMLNELVSLEKDDCELVEPNLADNPNRSPEHLFKAEVTINHIKNESENLIKSADADEKDNNLVVKQLTPEQVTAKLKILAVTVKERVRRLEEAKRISPETWQTTVTI